MRIEFDTSTETLAGLRLILTIVGSVIDARGKPFAQSDIALTPENAPRLDPSVMRRFAETIENEAAVIHQSEMHRPPGAGMQGAPIGINEKTGEIDNDANAARAAFGKASPPPSPPADGVASAATAAQSVGAPAAANTSTRVPAPPTATNASTGGTAERDSKGVPWDTRIHSEAKTRNNDGSWRYKRKLDEAVKAAVLAEITLGTGANASGNPLAPNVPTPPSIPPVPPPPPPAVSLPSYDAKVPVPPAPPARMPDATVSVVVPRPPVNPTAPAPDQSSATAPSSVAGTASPISFGALVIKMNKALAAGSITQENIANACTQMGIDSPGALSAPANAALIAEVNSILFPG